MRSLPLHAETLFHAYRMGIFPMDVDGQICWFCPEPRTVLPLDDRFHVSRSLRKVWRRGAFEIRIDTAFEEVMRACGDRPEGTWISEEIIEAYVDLFRKGYAHCLECWQADELVGGIYGVAIGGAFFGESMFHRRTNASKIALVELVSRLRERGYALLDVQFTTGHLKRFGAVELSRRAYLQQLEEALKLPCQFVP